MSDWEKYSAKHVQLYHADSSGLVSESSGLLPKYISSFPWQVMLDMGCGDGILLYALEKNGWAKGKSVIAIDISKNRIEKAMTICEDFQCFVDDACNMKHVASDSIDFVVSSMVIEHVANDEDMIREISRVLRKKGIAYIATVFKSQRAWYFYKHEGHSVVDPTHVREYTNDNQLLDKLRMFGLEIIESYKSQAVVPILGDLVLGRIGAKPDAFVRHSLLRLVNKIRIPILGYQSWQVIVEKKG